MTEKELIIFVKKTEAGKVKTRLASEIGDKKALEVYLHLLQITKKVADESLLPYTVWYHDGVENADLWSPAPKAQQADGDLGVKMKLALAKTLKNTQKACLIGSDCPQLTAPILHAAFEALEKVAIVLGPAQDGGYYLIGMKEEIPEIFENIEWSTPEVFRSTLAIIHKLDLTYHLLPILTDIDTLTDLHQTLPNYRL